MKRRTKKSAVFAMLWGTLLLFSMLFRLPAGARAFAPEHAKSGGTALHREPFREIQLKMREAVGSEPVLTEDDVRRLSIQRELDVAAAAMDVHFQTTEDGAYIFPDDYAGAHYADGRMIVGTTDPDRVDWYHEMTGRHPLVDVVVRPFSYDELAAASIEYMERLGAQTAIVSEANNSIVIGVDMQGTSELAKAIRAGTAMRQTDEGIPIEYEPFFAEQPE